MMTTTTRTHTDVDSPIGTLTLVAQDGVLCGLYLPGHLRGPERASLGDPDTSADGRSARSRAGDFAEVVRQLDEYFAGARSEFTVPVAPVGTPFQMAVWQQLTTIGYGQTATYAQIARTLGGPTLIRAVGAANARNPISIIVPCHRVIGSDGSLTGYAGGLDRKRFLLDLEARHRLDLSVQP
jgi:methylated-DNA-[protein]-cysteine S-methyltransferase